MRDFLSADSCARNASSEDEMQRNIDTFSSACDAFELTISTTKTEVTVQPTLDTNYSDPTITVKCQKLQTVDKSSDFSAVPCPEMCLSSTRLMQELPNQAQLSERFVKMCGNDKNSIS